MIDVEYASIKNMLKNVLKERRISYADLAEKMELSEITIKRIFAKSGKSYSAKVFDICQVLNISFFNLVDMAKVQKKRHFSLNQKQDRFFTKNLGHFSIFREIYRHRSMDTIKKLWSLNETQLFKILMQLEKLELIEVLENNQVRVLPDGVMELQMNSQLEIKLRDVLTTPFLQQFNKKIDSEEVFYHNSEIEMSVDTKKALMQDLKNLIAKYCELGLRDKNLLSSKKLISVRWLLCFSKYQTDWRSFHPLTESDSVVSY